MGSPSVQLLHLLSGTVPWYSVTLFSPSAAVKIISPVGVGPTLLYTGAGACLVTALQCLSVLIDSTRPHSGELFCTVWAAFALTLAGFGMTVAEESRLASVAAANMREWPIGVCPGLDSEE